MLPPPQSWKVQTLESTRDGTKTRVVITETNSFKGIPYADYFNVCTEWVVEASSEGARDSSGIKETRPDSPRRRALKGASAPGADGLRVTIRLDFQFLKSTWLQSTIESNTKAELIGVYEKWLEAANETLRRALDARGGSQLNLKALGQLGPHLLDEEGDAEGKAIDIDIVTDAEAGAAAESSIQVIDEHEDEVAQGYAEVPLPMRSSPSSSFDRSLYPSDEEDMLFFDCEEGGAPFRTISSGALEQAMRGGRRRSSTRSGSGSGSFGSKPAQEDPSSARDVAVTIVETVFVLAEFSYWRVHGLYVYDLKDVFDVDPGQVVSRIRNSFLPGWHSPILLHPDLYGPLLAVFMLPQSLLISMEISRHGCNPMSQLANALIVSLFIWVGLSSIYRLLSMLIAPPIELRHCLSMTGYSFFSWNLALLCAFPLENYKEVLRIPTMLPLVILGIPSSLAQGCMFWEHTPASSMTLQPSQLPSSMQQFATNHNRCLQKILWALPKILAFVLVAGTHYQFLWYMARVFLPGRRQICQLSALVQPGQYADILTQKELRVFAASLFGKKD
ncbi:hypothetical protein B484DRAFT_54184 [Ochromonadaceae sp. CCMP2298]|nr:hypothetical protein B484DRAFT_54184 [Ochromonadaceae sp. CCMP2298]